MKLPHALGCGICAVLIAAAVLIPTDTEATATGTACVAPAELVRLDHPLPRTGRRLAAGMPLTIVTIGSSSTAGAGASSPAMSYPSRLAIELKALLPRADVKVINRGVGGETVKEMLARFDDQVIAEKPDVVVWQVGSNSVLRDQPLAPAGALIRDGLRRLKAAGPDVILMNPQYAPKVIAKHDAELMVDLISLAAKDSNVDLFQRFAVMRHWRLTENIPFETFVSPDELHMNDWSYACIAKLLAGAIAEAATRPTQTAGAARR
jgi:lysophospholipase L1-like esterase